MLQLPGGFFCKMNAVFLLFTEADELHCSNLVVIVPISLLLFEFILCTQHYCMSGCLEGGSILIGYFHFSLR